MKKFFQYLKTRPLGMASLILLVIVYLVMIFAEFVAPYPASRTFDRNSYHPANLQLTSSGLVAREYRVINQSTWQYARVSDEGYSHPVKLFVKGSPYKLLGLIPTDIHLFGTEPSDDGTVYPVYLLGADILGRDLFSRIVYGSRISLTIGFVATAISLFLAVLLGGLSGYFGGATDWTIMRFAEFFMLIPSLYFILFLRSLLNTRMDSGTSYMLITVILALVGWPGTARTIRGMVHAIKREEFVVDADLEGIPAFVVIFRQIIPQIASLLIVSIALSVPGFIMSETTLSYLGLGINDPAVSWGSLINRDISTLSNLIRFPWLLYPVLMLLIVTLAFNFIGDVLRDFYDPYNIVFNRRKLAAFFRTTQRSGSPSDAASKAGANSEAPQPAPDALLSVRNLHVTFSLLRGTTRIPVYGVRGVSFDLSRGEILGIVGESGSGKSVSTTAIPGLLPANAQATGSIFFEGVDLMGLAPSQLREYRGKRIGLIFQEPGRSFDPLQSIGKVFWETFRNSQPDITREESDRKAVALLQEVELPDPEGRLKAYPHQFSGGQLQRIGIALALAQNCQLLIADEPTTALDVTIEAQIVSLLLRLKEERGLSVIFISHDIHLVGRISDRIAVMYGGKIMETGSSQQILASPRHPYTQALIAATPEFGSHYTTQRMASIPGQVSDPTRPLPGCPFQPRCQFAKEECRQTTDCWRMEE
ncbi:MAG: ATP-binding cassette domain-containing protein [Spirochaetaceae bacterium]|nr:ATP-binding cassette domain-containing protein [Spirochaetaceae bacterium]MBQ8562143.1 ATP-binding cassette domain-containing protein [Spirochaetaceae bacterium]